MEQGNPHHSLEEERLAEKLLLMPEEELEQMLDRELLNSSMEWAASNLGDSRLRSVKNGIITLITQVCRVAMKYGVDPEFAYTLSDYYIGHLETLNSPGKLMDLMKSILIHYNVLTGEANAPDYSRKINRAVEYISRNLYMPVKVSDVAGYVGLEPHYFSSLFRKETGLTPYRYILKQKLKAATERLATSDDSVTYISAALGFCDASHFEKRFREEYGMTPSAYRSKISGSEKSPPH